MHQERKTRIQVGQVRNSFLLAFLWMFFLVCFLQNRMQSLEQEENLRNLNSLSNSNEDFTIQLQIGSVQNFDSHNATNGTDEIFELSVIEAIGSLKLEEAIASLEKPVVFEKPEVVKKILLVGSLRSGASFLGDLINSSPGVFYSFDPLSFVDLPKPQPSQNPIELIRSIFDCNFSTKYLQHINKPSLSENTLDPANPDLMRRNRRVSHYCNRHNSSLCTQPDFIHRLCVHFPIRLVKEVRLSLDEMMNEDELMTTTELEYQTEWKIVYLARDPRAVMASRDILPLCAAHPSCTNFTRLCNTMEKDLARLETLRAQYPDRYYLVKHDEFSLDVEAGTQKLFDFLGIPVTAPVRVFLETHTKGSEDGKIEPHSTYRFSKNVVNAWREQMKKKRIKNITTTCSKVLKALNYTLS